MNYWTTRQGQKIQVNHMKISHVENTLKMLIRKYEHWCLTHGAKHVSGIDVTAMSDIEKRFTLDKTCEDRGYLKQMVARECYGDQLLVDFM